ncbi:MAG: hypothetical protein JWP63_6195 [Candidatus Solibacter sp.]|nr:hypothetical protein [Candidatus Solibacter sp.]
MKNDFQPVVGHRFSIPRGADVALERHHRLRGFGGGAAIHLSEAEFAQLFGAFFAEMERKFV